MDGDFMSVTAEELANFNARRNQEQEHGGRAAKLRVSGDAVVVFKDHTVAIGRDGGFDIVEGTINDKDYHIVTADYREKVEVIEKRFDALRKQGTGGNAGMSYPEAKPETGNILAPFISKAKPRVNNNDDLGL
jgi:hypothetical protein